MGNRTKLFVLAFLGCILFFLFLILAIAVLGYLSNLLSNNNGNPTPTATVTVEPTNSLTTTPKQSTTPTATDAPKVIDNEKVEPEYDEISLSKIPTLNKLFERLDRKEEKANTIIEYRYETVASGACHAYVFKKEDYQKSMGFEINCYAHTLLANGTIYELAGGSDYLTAPLNSQISLRIYNLQDGVIKMYRLTSKPASYSAPIVDAKARYVFFAATTCSGIDEDSTCLVKFDLRDDKLSTFSARLEVNPASRIDITRPVIDPKNKFVMLVFNDLDEEIRGFSLFDFEGKLIRDKFYTDIKLDYRFNEAGNIEVFDEADNVVERIFL